MGKSAVRFFALAAPLTLLIGCSLPMPKSPDSPYAKTPVGSTLELHHSIDLPPGATRIYVQDGKLSTRFNHYAPNCNIEVRAIDRNAAQTIEAGLYRVIRVQSSYEEVVQTPTPVRLAALGSFDIAGMDDGGSAMIHAGYHLYLEGADPNVARLSCRGAFADPSDALPPSIAEIRRTLGELMTLRVAEGVDTP